MFLLVVGLTTGGLYGAAAFMTGPSGASPGVSTALLARVPFLKRFLLPGFFSIGGDDDCAGWLRPPQRPIQPDT
jgi:hypothetical protein